MALFKSKKNIGSEEILARLQAYDTESEKLSASLASTRGELSRALAEGDTAAAGKLRQRSAELAEEAAARPLGRAALEHALRQAKRRERKAQAEADQRAAAEFTDQYLQKAEAVRRAAAALEKAITDLATAPVPGWLVQAKTYIGRRFWSAVTELFPNTGGLQLPLLGLVNLRLRTLTAGLPMKDEMDRAVQLATADRLRELDKEEAADVDPLPATAPAALAATA